eukprot:scaffold21295_cov100-Isochrysis_galbana.AAC.3
MRDGGWGCGSAASAPRPQRPDTRNPPPPPTCIKKEARCFSYTAAFRCMPAVSACGSLDHALVMITLYSFTARKGSACSRHPASTSPAKRIANPSPVAHARLAAEARGSGADRSARSRELTCCSAAPPTSGVGGVGGAQPQNWIRPAIPRPRLKVDAPSPHWPGPDPRRRGALGRGGQPPPDIDGVVGGVGRSILGAEPVWHTAEERAGRGVLGTQCEAGQAERRVDGLLLGGKRVLQLGVLEERQQRLQAGFGEGTV